MACIAIDPSRIVGPITEKEFGDFIEPKGYKLCYHRYVNGVAGLILGDLDSEFSIHAADDDLYSGLKNVVERRKTTSDSDSSPTQ